MKTILFILSLFIASQSFAQQTRTGAQITVNASTTSTLLLPYNGARNYLLVINKDNADSIYVKIGSAHSGTEGVLIPPLGNWEPPVAPLGSLYIKASANTPAVNIIEGTR